MKNYKFKRVGRPKKQHGYRSAFWILVVAFSLAFICPVIKDISIVQPAIASATDSMQEYKNYQVSSLEEENELLREKLDRSLKSVTSETTKSLAKFYIHKYFPQSEWANAEKISYCESGMNPMSLNEKNKNGSVDRGMFQINSVHAKRFESMYGVNWTIGAHDLDLSTKYAKFLYDHSGWNPWVCSKVVHV